MTNNIAAGSLADIGKLIATCGVIGACAGSIFVFKGAYRAVLIRYPTPAQKDDLMHPVLGSDRARELQE